MTAVFFFRPPEYGACWASQQESSHPTSKQQMPLAGSPTGRMCRLNRLRPREGAASARAPHLCVAAGRGLCSFPAAISCTTCVHRSGRGSGTANAAARCHHAVAALSAHKPVFEMPDGSLASAGGLIPTAVYIPAACRFFFEPPVFSHSTSKRLIGFHLHNLIFASHVPPHPAFVPSTSPF